MGYRGLFFIATVVLALFSFKAAQALVLVGSGPFHAALYERLSADYAFQRDDVKLAYSLAPPADTCQALALYDLGLVDFVSISYPMATDDACGPPGGTPYNSSTDALVQVPVAATAVVLGYRLDALTTTNGTTPQEELVLSAAILVGIVNGTVTHWDHPLVRGLNPTSLGTFAGPITLVYSALRNSPGNIGDVLASALRSASPAFGAWLDASYGGNLTLALAACPAAVEAADPIGSVSATDGAITYCPIEEAIDRDLPYASMMNRAGYKVRAGAASVAAAMSTLAANATMAQKLSIVNTAASGSWPLANLVLATMRLNRRLVEKKVDCLYIRETLSFLSWSQINSAAGASAGQLGFDPLSFGYKRLGTNLLQSVLCNGVPAVGKGILFGNGSPNEVYQTLTQSFSSRSFSLKYFGSTTAGGISALKAREADFAIISTALSPADQLAMPHVKPVPFTAMAIAPAYNIQAISGRASLVLSMEVITGIYMDRITKWNDPAIVALNPLLNGSLPDADIRLIYQSTFSTITYIYSRALTLVVPEFAQNIGWGYTIHFPAEANNNTVGVDSLDVMQVVQDTPNSLAMWTSNYDAKERQAKPASMINRDGETVVVSQHSMASSINALIAESPVEIFWAPGPDSWPILTVNSLLLDTRQHGDCARLASLVEWLYWSQTSADALGTIFASGLGVPSASGPFVKAMLLNYVADIKCDDEPVSALAGCIHNGTLCSDMGNCIQGSCFCAEGRTGQWCEEWKQDSSSADTVLIVLLSVIIPLALLLLLVLALLALFVCWQQRRRNNAQEDWQILPEMLEFGESLGQGSYGEVHKAMWKGTEVAVKVIKRTDVTREMEASFKDEARTMARLRHPNVVLFMAACTKPPNMCIVMEYMALGSLWDLIHNELVASIPPKLKVKILYQAAKGMHFLHSSGIVHRDLKSLNLLLDNKWNVKVGDFGLTAFKDSLGKGHADTVAQGTIHWSAPEVLSEDPNIDHSLADVYSFGVVMWELVTRAYPYTGLSPAQIAVSVIRDQLRPSALHQYGYLSVEEQRLVEILERCWSQDYTMRPTFLEVMTQLADLSKVAGAGTSRSSSSSTTHSTLMAGYDSNLTTTGLGDTVSISSSSKNERSNSTNGDDDVAGLPVVAGRLGGGGGEAAKAPLSVPRTDVSFVVCDLRRFAEVWHADAAVACDAIAAYLRIIRRRASEHRGHLFSPSQLNSGGTCMLAFHSPSAAVAFAVAVQTDALQHDTLESRSRVGISLRRGQCRAPPDDFLKTSYVDKDYKEACMVCAHCAPQRIECSKEFVQLAQETETSLSFSEHGAYARVLFGHQTAEHDDDDNDDHGQNDSDDDDDDDDEGNEGARTTFDWGGSAYAMDGLCTSNSCSFIIDPKKLSTNEKDSIGEGTYGRVYTGSYLGTAVAIKTLFGTQINDAAMLGIRREAAILSDLDHPHIVKLIGLSHSSSGTCLVMELMPKGSLEQLLYGGKAKALRYEDKMRILRDTALGLGFLHERGIVHRDIKPSNLLIDSNGAVKVGDFGFATTKLDTMTRCGSPVWMAPETLSAPRSLAEDQRPPTEAEEGFRLDAKADVYSFGIVMWQVLTQKRPYEAPNGGEKPFYQLIQEITRGVRPTIPSDCPDHFGKMLQACWHQKARKRPSMEELIMYFNAQADPMVVP